MMSSRASLTAAQRHFTALLIGALPAAYIGFRIGLFAADIGSHHALTSVFMRALVCAAPVASLALIAPRAWLLPSLIYAFCFYVGYDFFETARGLRALSGASSSAALVSAVTGQPLWAAAPSSHPELLWLLLLALWTAAFISFLRCYHSRTDEHA
jgi:hypothetical protein